MTPFALEAQRLRIAAGISQAELARRAFISSGHLSRMLAGTKPVSPAIAGALDTALNADGRLASLATEPGDEYAAQFKRIGAELASANTASREWRSRHRPSRGLDAVEAIEAAIGRLQLIRAAMLADLLPDDVDFPPGAMT